MPTSLGEQLRRLATPQTSALVDSTKRPSILFDVKEAANKDRETIYDIGLSGLQELIKLNPIFGQFESTLFDRTARDLVRSIESSEVNRNLNKTIRKFFYHLSPHFLLQSSHKCLEWLIRRFSVHEFNIDDFVMLILPYHETRIFVRCVQILQIRQNDEQHRWHWLGALRRPGITLSKQVLFNRAGTDKFLLKFICKSVTEAVKELGNRAYSLQTLFAFYCTTILGVLDGSDNITDSHISNIYLALSRGLSASAVPDFCAASLMITGQLVVKTKLSFKFLDTIIQKIVNITNPGLQVDAIILLCVLYEHQSESLATVSDESLLEIISNKWIPSALANNYTDGIDILPFYLPLITACLKIVQLKGQQWKLCKQFCENLLLEVVFTDDAHSEAMIRSIFEAYILREKHDSNVIDLIDSDDDVGDGSGGGDNTNNRRGIELNDTNMDINSWYSEILKSLDRQYPQVFDRVTKSILKNPDGDDISSSKRKSLKTVLGFLFTAACSGDGANIFENLYHHNAVNRIEAMRYLVKNFESLSFSDDSKNLLKDSISERMSDDSAAVVTESLKFKTQDLIQMLDHQHFVEKLIFILSRNARDSRWFQPTKLAIQHITSKEIWNQENINEIFLTIWPFMFPLSEEECQLMRIICQSDIGEKFTIFKSFNTNRTTAKNATEINKLVEKQLSSAQQQSALPNISSILTCITEILAKKLTIHRATYSMLLLAYLIPKTKCDPIVGHRIMDLINKINEKFKKSLALIGEGDGGAGAGDEKNSIEHCNVNLYSVASDNKFPINLLLNIIEKLVSAINWQPATKGDHVDFSQQSSTLSLAIKIYDHLVQGVWYRKDKTEIKKYNESLVLFMGKVFTTLMDKMKFFVNFFNCHLNDDRMVVVTADGGDAVTISPVFQLQSIRIFNMILENTQQNNENIPLTLPLLVNILSGLVSKHETIRQCTFQTIELLHKSIGNNNADAEQSKTLKDYSLLLERLMKRKEEILLDRNQLSLILCRYFSSSKSSNRFMSRLVNEQFELFINEKCSNLLRVTLLDILKHINNAEILKKITGTSLSILTRLVEVDPLKVVKLNQYESYILKMILYRFNTQTISAIKTNPSSWEFIIMALQNHNIQLTDFNDDLDKLSGDDGGGGDGDLDKMKQQLTVTTSIAILAMELFDIDFFNQLTDKQKTHLIRVVINLSATSQNSNVLLAATKLMRNIEIDVNTHLDIFIAMKLADVRVPEPVNKKSTRQSKNMLLSPDILTTMEWKCGLAMLEYLQNKKNLNNVHVLLPHLFAILKRCLQFEDQSLVEYTKQLTLACMLHCCQLISPDGLAKRDLIPDKIFEIELVVQCIGGTQNPQTHHHALQLLSHTAAMVPELVLYNMMNIFTFVGSSVVRRDDAYTYQIISNIIKSIIPTLIQSNKQHSMKIQQESVIPVLRVFADIILDVPEHRRLRLYEDLLNTLNAGEYMWMFLAILFENHVRHFKPNEQGKSTTQLKRIDVAVELTNQFDCETILQTCTKLIEHLHSQPTQKGLTDDGTNIDITDINIFNVHNYSAYQLKHFKYTTLQFIIQLTERTSRFVLKMASLTDDETMALKPAFKLIIMAILQFIAKVVKLVGSGKKEEKFWKIILTNSYDILDQVLALLYPEMLLNVVSGLLHRNNIPEVRRKAIELLNKKLQLENFFDDCDQQIFASLLEPLSNIIESIIDETKLVENATKLENVSLQQQALIGVKLLSVHLGKLRPQDFQLILDTLSKILKHQSTMVTTVPTTTTTIIIPMNVLAQSILCLAEICANIRAHALCHLPKFMPALGQHLKNQIDLVQASPNISLYILTAIHKIIETLPLFLNPYLVSLIVSLSRIWAGLLQHQSTVNEAQRKLLKLSMIWKKLATILELRVLIPMIDQSYRQIIEEDGGAGSGDNGDTDDEMNGGGGDGGGSNYSGAIGPLMNLMAESLQTLTGSVISPYQEDLGIFFVMALEFRSNTKMENDKILIQEDHIIDAFVGLVLKLSESSFRPLYYTIYNWAIRDSTSVDRAITFYRLSSQISESLKSLFVLFAGEFLQNAADLLKKCIKSNEQPSFANDEKCAILVKSIMQTIYHICLYDSQGFINHHRFDQLLEPLVEQLINPLVLSKSGNKELLMRCLAQLAMAANDDTMWKLLNYQILLKTRNSNADIRIFAIESCVEMAKKLGENYLPLLPETIPFFAEMLEDENVEVEKACQASVQELERVLGEPLQKYF